MLNRTPFYVNVWLCKSIQYRLVSLPGSPLSHLSSRTPPFLSTIFAEVLHHIHILGFEFERWFYEPNSMFSFVCHLSFVQFQLAPIKFPETLFSDTGENRL